MLQSMGFQRVGHNLGTEQQQRFLKTIGMPWEIYHNVNELYITCVFNLCLPRDSELTGAETYFSGSPLGPQREEWYPVTRKQSITDSGARKEWRD